MAIENQTVIKRLKLDKFDFKNESEVVSYIKKVIPSLPYLDARTAEFILIENIDISSYFFSIINSPFSSFFAIKHRRKDLSSKDLLLLEVSISSSARISYAYSSRILYKRFPLGEPIILKSFLYRSVYLNYLKSLTPYD
jgi:hypothetical protein